MAELHKAPGDNKVCVVPSRQGVLTLEHHRTDNVALHALISQGRPRDVAAKLFQRLAVIGAAAHRRVNVQEWGHASVGSGLPFTGETRDLTPKASCIEPRFVDVGYFYSDTGKMYPELLSH